MHWQLSAALPRYIHVQAPGRRVPSPQWADRLLGSDLLIENHLKSPLCSSGVSLSPIEPKARASCRSWAPMGPGPRPLDFYDDFYLLRHGAAATWPSGRAEGRRPGNFGRGQQPLRSPSRVCCSLRLRLRLPRRRLTRRLSEARSRSLQQATVTPRHAAQV
jgi:hypothetical protein